MKRDIDRMIEILSYPRDFEIWIDEYDAYQIWLLADEGYLHYRSILGEGREKILDIKLTKSGHDFVDLMGHELVYKKVNETLISKGFDIKHTPFEIIIKLAEDHVKSMTEIQEGSE